MATSTKNTHSHYLFALISDKKTGKNEDNSGDKNSIRKPEPKIAYENKLI